MRCVFCGHDDSKVLIPALLKKAEAFAAVANVWNAASVLLHMKG